MISRTYDPVAKRFVSLGEMNPVDFTGVPFRRGPKRNGAKSTAAFRTPGRRRDAAGGQGGGTFQRFASLFLSH
jgi:hypothetical protein